VLDFGCGSGENSIYLSRCGYKVFSLDASKKALKIVRKKNKLLKNKLKILLFSDTKKLQFKENFFDYIICLSVISLLGSKKNIQELINEFHRVLKPGGKLIIDINARKGDFLKKSHTSKKKYKIYLLKSKKKKNFIKIYNCKSKKNFLNFFKKFKVDDVGEIFFSYLNFNDHEYLALLEKK
jgi:ubiquinone/menaquinone biosynthesis C-methylase UbiE